MTRKSVREYLEAIRSRYEKATKEEKGRILDEFTKTTGIHRKSLIRLLNHSTPRGSTKRRGRPREYGVQMVEALRSVWEASDRLCSKRLQPFIPELVQLLRRCGERLMSADIEAQACRMSASTIDRRLRPWHRLGGRHPFSTTKPGSLLVGSLLPYSKIALCRLQPARSNLHQRGD